MANNKRKGLFVSGVYYLSARELQHTRIKDIHFDRQKSLLYKISGDILTEFDELFKPIQSDNPDMTRYGLELTIIKTPEYKKALNDIIGLLEESSDSITTMRVYDILKGLTDE